MSSSPLIPAVCGLLTSLQLICLVSFATPESWESKSVEFFFLSSHVSGFSLYFLGSQYFSSPWWEQQLPEDPLPPLTCAGGRLCSSTALDEAALWNGDPWARAGRKTHRMKHVPFAEVAAQVWNQYRHVCSLLPPPDELSLVTEAEILWMQREELSHAI